jgi:imidazolonepropionase-like amidohydrolase
MYMPAGPSTHLEIELLEKAGVTPLAIIQAATINAATALNIEDQYGSIQVGKVADLLISKNNPLKDLSTLAQPIAVVKAGQWLSKEDLLSLKESGKNPSNLYVSIGRFLEDWLTRKFH